MKSQSEFDYSNFGTYDLDKRLELTFANNKIIVSKINSDQCIFQRVSSDSSVKHNLNMGSDVKIHVCPILPLNIPEPMTNLLYLDFENPILVGKSLETKISIKYPIEIGIFVQNSNENILIDCFSCDPLLSRFALYGLPTNGSFCKYAKTFDETNINPYCYAIMDLKIKNNLTHAAKVGKIIINASSQDLHYSKKEIIADPILMTLERDHTITTSKHDNAITTSEPYLGNLEISSRIKPKTSKSFVMREGYD